MEFILEYRQQTTNKIMYMAYYSAISKTNKKYRKERK